MSKKLTAKCYDKKNRKIGPRKQRKRKTQQGAGLLGSVFNLGKNMLTSGALAKGLDMGSKTINFEIGKKLIDEGVKHAPELSKYGKSRVKTKNLKRALESDIVNYAAKQAEENLFNWQNG